MHPLCVQVTPVMKMNTPLELHASKIYTQAMLEKFVEVIYEAGQYKVEEVTKDKTYFVRRYHPEKHEKWCRIVYKVELVDGGAKLICECGNFEHTGLLCCHGVKVKKTFYSPHKTTVSKTIIHNASCVCDRYSTSSA